MVKFSSNSNAGISLKEVQIELKKGLQNKLGNKIDLLSHLNESENRCNMLRAHRNDKSDDSY